jgi:putative ABC transport system permease protein
VVALGKILLHSWANIRKTKGHTVSILLMFVIAALLLNSGLLVLLHFGHFFEKNTRELKTADVYYVMPNDLYTSAVDDYIRTHPQVKEMQREEVLWTSANIRYLNNQRDFTLIWNDADEKRQLSMWKFIGQVLPADAESIYVPYVFNLNGGYQLNDRVDISVKGTVLSFTIKGFIEDVYFSSLDTGNFGFYLPHEAYQQAASILGASSKASLVFANLQSANTDIKNGIRQLIKQDKLLSFSDATGALYSLDLSMIRLSRVMMASMVSVMIVVFAGVIAAVCLIVVRFRIGNSIEEDMVKIGSLKAMGYTSKQIILTIVAQFAGIALIGSLMGITLSYLTLPVLSLVFAHQSGLLWKQAIDPLASGITVVAILSVVFAVSYLSTRRIHRLNPIVALRSGILNHNIRRSYLPLEHTRGFLPVVLAWKSMLQNRKQSLMIAVILTVVSFASSFSVLMFYNSVVDTRTFAEIPGIELSNVLAVLKPETDREAIVRVILGLKDVRKAQFIEETPVMVDGLEVTAYVMADYSAKETNTVYSGRYPLHSNEIVIAGHLADKVRKHIGDLVTVQAGGKQTERLITGLSQGAKMGGMNVCLRLDGLTQLIPNFQQQSLHIYLTKGSNTAAFLTKLESRYGDALLASVDMDHNMEQNMAVYTSIVSQVGISMLMITLCVVILVLYFVINSSIIRRKRELGIQKALGFTTLQLMHQLSLGLLPPIAIGVMVGSLAGLTQTNAILSLAQRAMGIMEANYRLVPGWIAVMGLMMIAVSYLVSLLIALRIRHISAYALVSE